MDCTVCLLYDQAFGQHGLYNPHFPAGYIFYGTPSDISQTMRIIPLLSNQQPESVTLGPQITGTIFISLEFFRLFK